jgi:hypothetical protein
MRLPTALDRLRAGSAHHPAVPDFNGAARTPRRRRTRTNSAPGAHPKPGRGRYGERVKSGLGRGVAWLPGRRNWRCSGISGPTYSGVGSDFVRGLGYQQRGSACATEAIASASGGPRRAAIRPLIEFGVRPFGLPASPAAGEPAKARLDGLSSVRTMFGTHPSPCSLLWNWACRRAAARWVCARGWPRIRPDARSRIVHGF